MYAVIQTGGKQYKVQKGDVIYVEKLDVKDGAKVTFDVLMLQNDEEVKIGTPIVEGAKVTGKMVSVCKGEKIIIFKYKAKKNVRRTQGHRQPYSKVEINKIEG